MVTFEEHECGLQRDEKEHVMNSVIESGIFINLRRKWYEFCMINRKHPRTGLYFKSAEACRKEKLRNAVNYLYMIHPFSLFNLYWEFFLILVYPYVFIAYSWNAAVVYTEIILILNYVKVSGDVILLVDMIKIFFTGYYDTETSRVVLNPAKVARKYLLTYFLIDFISSFGSYVMVIRWMHATETIQHVFRISRYFNIIKVFRIPRWMEAIDLLRQYMNQPTYRFKALKVFLTYITVLFLLMSALIVIDTNYNRVILQRKDEEEIFERFYSATLILLVVSYGFKKTNEVSKLLIASCFLCIGYVLQLYLFAQILQIWNKFSHARSKNENLFQQFKEYMKYKALPVSLREKIFAYFNFRFQHEFFRESHINQMVSEVLRQEILMHVTKSHVEKVDFFKNLPDVVLTKIVLQLKSEIYLPEDVIVGAGTVANCMFFIYYGTVAIYTPTGKEVCHLEDGAHFGETAFIFKEIRVATVVAVTACELFKLKRANFLEAMEPFPDMKNQIVQMALDRLAKNRAQPV